MGWNRLRDDVPYHPSTHIPLAARKDAQRVMSLGEMFLQLTSCSTQESRPCTLPGQHSKASPGGGEVCVEWRGITAKAAPRAIVQESWTLSLVFCVEAWVPG